MLCHMEFCGKGVRGGKNKRLYLYGSGNYGRHFFFDPEGEDNSFVWDRYAAYLSGIVYF